MAALAGVCCRGGNIELPCRVGCVASLEPGPRARSRDPEASERVLRSGERPPKIIYAFIADRCTGLPVDACCLTMKVSRSAFFAWRHAQANRTERMLDDRELGDLVVKIHEQSFGTYGPGG